MVGITGGTASLVVKGSAGGERGRRLVVWW